MKSMVGERRKIHLFFFGWFLCLVVVGLLFGGCEFFTVPEAKALEAERKANETDAEAMPALVGLDAKDTMDESSFNAEIANVTSNAVQIRWRARVAPKSVTIELSPEPFPSENSAPVRLMKTLRGKSGRETIAPLGAAMHVFLRVKAVFKEKEATRYLWAKTIGGQRAKLKTPLRFVHRYAPDILALVFANGNGSAWQKSRWKLQCDGQAIAVRKVWRKSHPVGAPEYQVGFGGHENNKAILVDHHIFLKLAKPLSASTICEVESAKGFKAILPISDRYLETPVIQVNQVGYNPRASRRYAYLSAYLGDGKTLSFKRFPKEAAVLRESEAMLQPRKTALAKLPVTLRSANDLDQGGEVWEIDLSKLPANEKARYRVYIPGVGVSWRTRVSEKASFVAFFTAARGLFHNRWGGDLNKKATAWTRPVDHPFVYTAESTNFLQMHAKNTPKKGKRPLAGGYHDAGDFDQRPMHTIVPTLLLSAYEWRPERFKDGQLLLPEAGDKIPDLLNEALWGVKAWEALQEENGGVRLGVESYRHPWGIYFAHEDPLPYWTYGVHQNITARAAGLFAQAARLVKPYDEKRAKALEARARKAFLFATKHNAVPAFMLYAAGELFHLTGEERFKTEYEKNWKALGDMGPFRRMSLQANPNSFLGAFQDDKAAFAIADYVMGYTKAQGANPLFISDTRRWMRDLAKRFTRATFDNHAHRSPRRADGLMDWGHGTSLGRYTNPLIAMLRIGVIDRRLHQEIFDALSLSADYILGANPLGMVFYTGLGTINVREPLHLDALAFIKRGMPPIPGLPVFGPVQSPPNAVYSQPAIKAFYPAMTAFPKAHRYGDVRVLVVCNESTVWGDYAPNLKLFAALIGEGLMPHPEWKKGVKDF